MHTMYHLWTELQCESHLDSHNIEKFNLWITSRISPLVYLVHSWPQYLKYWKAKIIETGWSLNTHRHKVSKLFIDDISIIVVIVCLGALSVYYTYAGNPEGLKSIMTILWLECTHCEFRCGWWWSTPASLEGQSMLLTADTFLQPHLVVL